MILCFNCSPNTKRTLDSLVNSDHYRDYAEVISLAVDNLAVLRQRLGSQGAVVIEPKRGPTSAHLSHATPTAPAMPIKHTATRQERERQGIYVPTLFALQEVRAVPCEAPSPVGAFKRGERVPLERWIFGQYNRLLPAKVSCRALANLLSEHPNGVDLEGVGPLIAKAAWELGDSLAGYEAQSRVHPDEGLSTAFPISGKGGEKSLLRFRTQFVASSTKAGDLLGLLADLKLIGNMAESTDRVALTSTGWRFALMRNPVLEGEQQSPTQKFSPAELELLLSHLAAEVPVEDFAYRAVLTAVEGGATRPANLDVALTTHVSLDAKHRITSSFVSTQRSGAVSRMSDLGLIARVRDGVRVSYVVTAAGLNYLKA